MNNGIRNGKNNRTANSGGSFLHFSHQVIGFFEHKQASRPVLVHETTGDVSIFAGFVYLSPFAR